MTTTTITRTDGTVLFTTQAVTSNTAFAGAVVSTNGAIGMRVNVKLARTAAASHGATVFRLEVPTDSGGNGWTPIYTWTTALHGSAPTLQTLNSNAAAGAVSVQLSAALGSALSAPIAIVNSATPANTEWNFMKIASTQAVLLNSLANGQTANVSYLTSYAEMWSIPVDITGVTKVRLVVDNVWNAVANPVIVSATVNLDTNATTA